MAVSLDRVHDDHARMLSLAWHVAAFSRHETLPDLERLLDQSRPVERKTVAAQRTQLAALSQHVKIPLVTLTRKQRIAREAAAREKIAQEIAARG